MMLEQLASQTADDGVVVGMTDTRVVDDAERAWALVAGLGRAVTLAQVARFIVEAGQVASGATAGVVATLAANRRVLRIVTATGTTGAVLGDMRYISVGARHPLADVVRTRREMWMAPTAEVRAAYPDLELHADSTAWIVLPLTIDSVVLGAVAWTYAWRDLAPGQRAILRALARGGGEALFRVGLFESERRARAEAELARDELAGRCLALESERVQLVATLAQRESELEINARRDALLAQVSLLMDSAADPIEALQHAAKASLPLLGDWCAIEIVGDDGRLRRVAEADAPGSARRVPRADHLARGYSSRKLARQLRAGRVIEMNALAAEPGPRGAGFDQLRTLADGGLQHVMVIPMRVHGSTVGTLAYGRYDANRTFGEADVALGRRLGRCCATAIEHASDNATAHQAVQARDEFVASTSHEFRTPLSHIKGFVSTLRSSEGEWDAETRDDFLEEIERESDRLAKLVDDLLEMSRIDSGGLDPAARSAVAPATLVAVGINRVGSQGNGHPLEVHVSDELPAVWVDASQVERVIANLLDNASKYSPPGEAVSITGRLMGDKVSLRVEDRGLGIPPEDLERIFEPFFREPKGGYPAKPGTGLGLAICRSIVRSQHGRIWAEQRADGGAAFEFTLPIASQRRTRR